MTKLPDDIVQEALAVLASLSPFQSRGAQQIGLALLAERQKTARACVEIASNQAWSHGGEYFDGPELNSLNIAQAIERAFLEPQAQEG